MRPLLKLVCFVQETINDLRHDLGQKEQKVACQLLSRLLRLRIFWVSCHGLHWKAFCTYRSCRGPYLQHSLNLGFALFDARSQLHQVQAELRTAKAECDIAKRGEARLLAENAELQQIRGRCV